MAKPSKKLNQTQQIRAEFEGILRTAYPKPLNFNTLRNKLYKKFKGKYDEGSITAQFSVVVGKKPNEFGKHREKDLGVIYYYTGPKPKHHEKVFYDSFATYLMGGQRNKKNDYIGECTRAIPWGGNKSGGKWGTPDVVGIHRSEHAAYVKLQDEIISAEIKISSKPDDLIIGFGQACAYRLFSHKVYLVVPKSGQNSRLKSLCHLSGIGLVYFDPTKEITASIYKKELPARHHSPDRFHVNDFISDDLGKQLYDG